MTNRNFEISVAPMMDWTDRHCRYFHRLIAPHVRLYTEMVTSGVILHGDRDRFLRFDPAERPLALQLGGSDPAALAACTAIAAPYGYDEINLNCGCPSDRVQSGKFGACLMNDPALVARCVGAMQEKSPVPVTVKCRIGIDNSDNYSFLNNFIKEVSKAGCQKFIIHARKAWLNGLSPKENRDIPPLDYARVHRLKQDHKNLAIILNGGLEGIVSIQKHTSGLDGAMIGRAVYRNPFLLADLAQEFYGIIPERSREDIAMAMIPYIDRQAKDHGTPVKSITRHMIGLFHEQPGGRRWRRYLSENAHHDGQTGAVIEQALSFMQGADEQDAPSKAA